MHRIEKRSMMREYAMLPASANVPEIRERPVAPEPPTEPTYLSVVSLQKFSGEWELDKDLAKVMKSSIEILEKEAPVKAQNVWATVLALCYLDVKFGDKRDEWEMVDRKARQWLDLQDREGHALDDLMAKARAVIDQL